MSSENVSQNELKDKIIIFTVWSMYIKGTFIEYIQNTIRCLNLHNKSNNWTLNHTMQSGPDVWNLPYDVPGDNI